MNINGNQFPNGFNQYGFANQHPNSAGLFTPQPGNFFPGNQPAASSFQPMHAHPSHADIQRAEQLTKAIVSAEMDSDEMKMAIESIATSLTSNVGSTFLNTTPSSKFAWLVIGKSLSLDVIQKMVAAANKSQAAMTITEPKSVVVQLRQGKFEDDAFKLPAQMKYDAFTKLFEEGVLAKAADLMGFLENSDFLIGSTTCYIVPSGWYVGGALNYAEKLSENESITLAKAFINYVRDQGHADHATATWLLNVCVQLMVDIAAVRSSPLAQDLELPAVTFVLESDKAPAEQFGLGYQRFAQQLPKSYRVARKGPDGVVIELLKNSPWGCHNAARFDNAPSNMGE